ncbi:LuxR family transcriptional regulator [Laribacter hongkongensis]|uniref:LuxR family transcriptional regulator n=1 Tax=Laribacter hongkongensis TaxID=168471 RepID=UPI001EFE838C|nr:response regulator transcription factor [Laribacter hongkongensis]MCG9032623.1 response regulator transcription factor [Laribacter hongkongensis]MCG9091565.1 response regulator transcription factor [Laribacter hongkongensis]
MRAPYLVSPDPDVLAHWQAGLGGTGAQVATLEALGQARPGIVLLDADGYPQLAPAASLSLLARHRVVVLTARPDEQTGLAWLYAGAVGYGARWSTPACLQLMCQSIGEGNTWVDQTLFARLRRMEDVRPAEDDWRSAMSGREEQVAGALSRGLSNKEIASELAISERTVKAHLSSLFQKFGVSNRLQLLLILRQADRR